MSKVNYYIGLLCIMYSPVRIGSDVTIVLHVCVCSLFLARCCIN